MNKNFSPLLIAIFMLLFSQCSKEQKDTGFQVRFIFEGLAVDSINYIISQDGIALYPAPMQKSIAMNKTKDTTLFFETPEDNFFGFHFKAGPHRKYARFIARPNETYEFTYGANPGSDTIKGDNSTGVSYLANKYFIMCPGVSGKYNVEKPIEDILDIYESDINMATEELDGFLKAKAIDSDYYNQLKAYVEYGYTYDFVQTVIYNIDIPPYRKMQFTRDTADYIVLIDSLLTRYPYDNKLALLYPSLTNYIDCSLWALGRKEAKTCRAVDIKCLFQLAEETLNDKYFEVYFANSFFKLLRTDTEEMQNQKLADFENRYPESASLESVRKLAKENIRLLKNKGR